MTDRLLKAALTDGDLRPLPEAATAHLEALDAPPRLAAHLRAVHDVAWQLTHALTGKLDFDRDLVLFGAAIHDIGKVRHPEEPPTRCRAEAGSLHEPPGRGLRLWSGRSRSVRRPGRVRRPVRRVRRREPPRPARTA
ncbi:HD domain-containing protein [Catenuloplanes sp. NPDC051500]|uniref:HD domain-containing protein n=1 Tax=Catenuloplanes sp. NPDC051500 TaxID=3363959 RepID=UPI003787F29B